MLSSTNPLLGESAGVIGTTGPHWRVISKEFPWYDGTREISNITIVLNVQDLFDCEGHQHVY